MKNISKDEEISKDYQKVFGEKNKTKIIKIKNLWKD